jgi:hypothetical protein
MPYDAYSNRQDKERVKEIVFKKEVILEICPLECVPLRTHLKGTPGKLGWYMGCHTLQEQDKEAHQCRSWVLGSHMCHQRH